MNTRLKLGAIGVALAVAALTQPATAQTHSMPGGAPMADTSSARGGGMEMMSLMKDMSDKMAAMPMTGKTDIDFAKMMRVHHQGAISMAEAELQGGKEPAMRKMAQDIIKAQKKEIAQIDRFLSKKGQ
jgi:uncharacterized protein (DUF305 family)